MTTGLPQPSAKNFGDKIREWALVGAGLLGDRMDSFVRVRDLEAAGIAGVHQRFIRGAGGPPLSGPGAGVAAPYEVDLTPPPTPTGLNVVAAITSLIIQCDPQLYTQGHGHDRTIVYGATYTGTGPLPTFASAVELTQFQGTVVNYVTQPSIEWHIWIKWKTRDGVLSAAPAGGTNGFTVTTGRDVRLLLDALTAAAEDAAAPYSKYAVRAGLFYVASATGPTDTPLFAVVTSPITVGGVVVPVGVYMADAFIMNGTITNAKIANLAVDDAKIATLSVSKLIAGSIAVGQFAQSTGYVAGSAGWRINGDGTAEFSGVIVRGAIFASSGTIGGSAIGSTFMRSTNYVLNSQGWALNADGTGQIGGFLISNTAIQSTNYVAGSTGWKFAFDGFLEARSGTFAGALAAATGTFSGALSAASGTFSGTLTAAAINAVDTINIAGNAVTVPASAVGSSNTGASIAITCIASQPVYILAQTDGSVVNTTLGSRTGTLKIDGSSVKTTAAVNAVQGVDSGGIPNAFSPSPLVLTHLYTPTAGSHTFEFTADGSATPATIFVMQTKR